MTVVYVTVVDPLPPSVVAFVWLPPLIAEGVAAGRRSTASLLCAERAEAASTAAAKNLGILLVI
jgi:hypothetical protein